MSFINGLTALPALPVLSVLPEVLAALSSGAAAVLQAAPGAGKTTIVPLALVDETWLRGQRILLLEPRRLAARAAAQRMAELTHTTVGDLVGFRMRGESKVSSRTRIEVVTEGILTRMLMHDPTLEGTGALIFDEFHERSIHADVGLALALQSQRLLRPDLRILVMSATLETTAVASLLGNAPVITSDVRAYPVETRYRAPLRDARLEDSVARIVRHALENDEGDILAFLPGAREILRCAELLRRSALPSHIQVFALFGALSARDQDAAIRPSPAGVRKIVLASAIAETSITIEGVRVVVDGGMARIARFSPRTGMARLVSVRVTHARATQRRGRAGRTAPGICYRLWAEEENAHLLAHDRPEILETDLTPLALDLASIGIKDVSTLEWLDSPPAAGLASARELLRMLGCLDTDDCVTSTGRAVAALGVDPRVGRMLVYAAANGCGATACILGALLEERDRMNGGGVDVRSRIDMIAGASQHEDTTVDRAFTHRVRERARHLRSQLRFPKAEVVDSNDAGILLAVGFPDRVAMRRTARAEGYLLRSGTGAVLPAGSALANEPWLSVAEVDGIAPSVMIRLAAPVSEASVRAYFRDNIVTTRHVVWSSHDGTMRASVREQLDALVLREVVDKSPDAERVGEVLLRAITTNDGVSLTWRAAAGQLRDRMLFIRSTNDTWPDVSIEVLMSDARAWLLPHLIGLRKATDVAALPLHDILLGMLTWEQRAALDQLAPTHFVSSSGSRFHIDYSLPEAPSIAARVQDFFGIVVHPAIGALHHPFTVQLLSPANRVVQVTRDLPGFWAGSYSAVRKEMKGRYPKHAWPESPESAQPRRR